MRGEYRRFVIVISGPSGAGKSSFVRELLNRRPDLHYSISATTRRRRPHETDGADYFFLAREEFDRRIVAGEFVEWAEVHGERYGTLKRQIDEAIAGGKNVLLDIDVQGGAAVRRLFPEAISIFILPPSVGSLESRLKSRGTDSDERIRLRLENAHREIELGREYDYTVVNDDLEAGLAQAAAIVEAETCRTTRASLPRHT